MSKTVKLCVHVAGNAVRKEEKWVDGEREGEAERRREEEGEVGMQGCEMNERQTV